MSINYKILFIIFSFIYFIIFILFIISIILIKNSKLSIDFLQKIPINIIQQDYEQIIGNKWVTTIQNHLITRELQIKNNVRYNNYRPYRLVVSLSTSPTRLSNIEIVLNDMLAQTLVPDAIYVFIPKVFKRTGETYDQSIIDKYNNKSPIIKCTIIKDDLGPITKILPVIDYEKDPQTIVISIDDDIQYHPDILYQYYCKSLLYNDAIVTLTSTNIKREPHKMYPIIEGYLGIAYRIYHVIFLYDEFNKHYKDLDLSCIGSDDLVLSSMIWYFNFRVYIGPFPIKIPASYEYGIKEDALRHSDVHLKKTKYNISICQNNKRYHYCKQHIIKNNIPFLLS